MKGDVIFMCGGPAAGVYIADEHDDAAREHCDAMNRAHRARTGEWASLDQQVEWLLEGREASERRATIEQSRAISEAIALLEKHGYRCARRGIE